MMTYRKTAQNITLYLLTIGASLILGLLSFGGMYALMPLLPLAIGSFALSIGYEGEVYLQNLKGALKKLFAPNHLLLTHAYQFLQQHFPKNINEKDVPQFFKDYISVLKAHDACMHAPYSSTNERRLKKIKSHLQTMELWFAFVLQTPTSAQTPYEQALIDYLTQSNISQWQQHYYATSGKMKWVKAFSVLSGVFMGLGSIYLLTEAFSIIPWLVAIPAALFPAIILPMAVISGVAYALLTFNTISDMISNQTLNRWYQKIKRDLSAGVNFHTLMLTTSSILFISLALALTLFTAGTWWTIAKHSKPLFSWLQRLPTFVMGVINPIVTGLASVAFNLQNSHESVDTIEDMMAQEGYGIRHMYQSIKAQWLQKMQEENVFQRYNPIRLMLNITLAPLRLFLFLGHLLSIGVTVDRIPNISKSMMIGVIFITMGAEGLEDLHYFFGDEHGHSSDKSTTDLLQERLSNASDHDHEQDLPTRIIYWLVTPLMLVQAVWDYAFSQFNQASSGKEKLTIKQAIDKAFNVPKAQASDERQIPIYVSREWQQQYALMSIEKLKQKHPSMSPQSMAKIEDWKQSVLVTDSNDYCPQRLFEAIDAPEIQSSIETIQDNLHINQ